MSVPVPSEPTAAQKRDAPSATTETPQGSSDDTDASSLDIPALDFIRTVWGFDSAKLHLDKWSFKLLPELLLRYKILHKNPEARQAFFAGLCAQALMDYISAMKKLGLEDEIQRVSSGYVLDESGTKAPYILDKRRKPFTTELSRLIFPRLQEVIAASAHPLTKKAAAKRADMPALWNSVLAYFVYEDIDPLSGSSTLPTSSVTFARTTTSQPIPRRGSPPPEAPSSNKKQRAADDADSDEDDLGIPPRQKDERSGEDAEEEEEEEEDVDYDRLTSSEYRARQHKRYTPEMLAEHYASQAFESEARRWTSGVMINEFTVSLSYHDRMGTLRAQPFDFVKEPECLLGLVVGLASAKYENFGFDPMIVKISKPAAEVKGKAKEKAAQADEMDVDSEGEPEPKDSEEKPEFTEADAELAGDLVQFLLKVKKFNVDPTGGHLNMGPNSVCLGRLLEEDSDGEDDGDEYESLLSLMAKEVGQEDMLDKIASLVKG